MASNPADGRVGRNPNLEPPMRFAENAGKLDSGRSSAIQPADGRPASDHTVNSLAITKANAQRGNATWSVIPGLRIEEKIGRRGRI